MIHHQASKAKNGQIQMHTLLLSSGTSIQPLTDTRQEKWGEKFPPGQLSLLFSVGYEPYLQIQAGAEQILQLCLKVVFSCPSLMLTSGIAKKVKK